jgi:dipeptidyl aminopeptidase/acylaminoacyl peptidase
MYTTPPNSIGTTASLNTSPDQVYGFIPTGPVFGPRNIAWSPDGHRLAFDGPATSLGTGRALYIMNADGTGLNQVGRGDRLRYNPAWSPDGMKLAFVQDNGPQGSGDIFTITTGGGSLTRLTTASAWDGSPDWSPDGTRIAYVCWSGGRAQLCQMDPAGGSKSVTTARLPLPGGVVQPSWSPDSANIAFAVKDAGGAVRGIYRVSRNGSSIGLLKAPPECCELGSSASWSPDGARIAFALINGGDGGLMNMSALDGTGAVQIQGNDDHFTVDAGGWQPFPAAQPQPRPQQPQPEPGPQPPAPRTPTESQPPTPGQTPSAPAGQTPSGARNEVVVIVVPGRPPLVTSPPSTPRQRSISRRQAYRTTKIALRRLYRKKFRNGSRYRAVCRRSSSTRWTCRVSWRYNGSRYGGTAIVTLHRGTGYSTTVRVRHR